MSFKTRTNPYEQGSPQWQLFESMMSAELLAVGHAHDAERATVRAADARRRAGMFREALMTIDPNFKPEEAKNG